MTWRRSETVQSKQQEGASAGNSQMSVPKRVPDCEHGKQAGSRENVSLIDSPESSPYVSASFLEDQLPRNIKVRPNDEGASVDMRSKGSWEGMRIRSIPESDMKDSNRIYITGHRKRAGSSIGYDPKTVRRKTSSSPYDDSAGIEEVESGSLHGNPSRDVSISGSPFIRAPLSQSQTPLGRSVESSSLKDADDELPPELQNRGSGHIVPKPSGLRTSTLQEGSQGGSLLDTDGEAEEQKTQLMVPVGVSRLHLVELPNLKV